MPRAITQNDYDLYMDFTEDQMEIFTTAEQLQIDLQAYVDANNDEGWISGFTIVEEEFETYINLDCYVNDPDSDELIIETRKTIISNTATFPDPE